MAVNVNRTLPALATGALEQPLAPRAIQCLHVNTPTALKPSLFTGELVLPPGATLDPAHDGLIVVLDGHAADLAPSAFTCDAQGCTFGASSPLVSGALIPTGGGGRLELSLNTDSTIPTQVPPPVLYLASRGLWAGADIASRERFAAPRPTLDVAGARSLSIGPAGGDISVFNSHRTQVTLAVPAGALPRATTITMTPSPTLRPSRAAPPPSSP